MITYFFHFLGTCLLYKICYAACLLLHTTPAFLQVMKYFQFEIYKSLYVDRYSVVHVYHSFPACEICVSKKGNLLKTLETPKEIY